LRIGVAEILRLRGPACEKPHAGENQAAPLRMTHWRIAATDFAACLGAAYATQAERSCILLGCDGSVPHELSYTAELV